MQKSLDPMSVDKTETLSASYVLRRRYGPARYVIAVASWVTVINLVLQPVAVLAATWDSNAGTAPNPNDGAGTWSAANSWWTGSANQTWVSGDDAIIGCGAAAAGTITVSAATTAASLTFNAPGSGNYTISISAGQPLTLAASAPVTVNANATISGGGALAGGAWTMSGAGILTLAGTVANTFNGLVTVNGGELDLGKTANVNAIVAGGLTINSAMVKYTGTSTDMIGASAVTVNSGGTLDIQVLSDTVGTVTINQGGTITGTSGVLTIGAGTTLTANDGGTVSGFTTGAISLNNGGLTYNDTIVGSTTLSINRLYLGTAVTHTLSIARGDDASGVDLDITTYLGNSANTAANLTKTGSGVMQLSGGTASSNLSTGTLSINDGTLLLNKSASVTAFSGTGTITVGDGTGSAGTAILRHTTASSINQILDNAVTVNSDGLWDLNGKTETTSGALTLNSGGQITIGAGNLTTGAAGVTGSIIATGVGTYTSTAGITVYSGGSITTAGGNVGGTTITVNNGGSIATSGGTLTGTGALVVNGTGSITTSGGNFNGTTTLASTGGGTIDVGAGTYTMNGNATYTVGAPNNALVITANQLNIGTLGRTFTVADEGTQAIDMDVQAELAGTGNLTITKTGAGTLRLGGDAVSTLGTGGLTLGASTGTVILNNSAGNAVGSGTVTIGASAMVQYGSYNNQLNDASPIANSGTLDLNGHTDTVGALTHNAGASILLGAGTLTVTSATTFSGTMTGDSGSSFTTSAGNLTLGAATSAITLNNGDVTVNGALTVNAAAGSINTGGGDIAVTAGITVVGSINTGGGNLNGTTLAMTGGSINTGAGTYNLGGAVTANSSATLASITASTLDLGAASRTFTIADNATADPDMEITAAVSNGTLAKAGAGQLRLSGTTANTATVSISAGTLYLNKTDGTDAIGSGGLTISGSTVVTLSANNQINDGATVTLGGGTLNTGTGLTDTINTLSMSVTSTLSGSGTITTGALSQTGITARTQTGGTATIGLTGNYSGANTTGTTTWNAPIALSGNVTHYFTQASGGTVTFAGAITGSDAINVNGAGTILISTPNTGFSGPVTVSSGTLDVRHSDALGSGTVAYTLNGGTLALKDNGTGSNQTLTWGDNVTVGGNATISVDRVSANTGNTIAMNTLTLAGYTLTVTGANSYSLGVANGLILTEDGGVLSLSRPMVVDNGVSGVYTMTVKGTQALQINSGAVDVISINVGDGTTAGKVFLGASATPGGSTAFDIRLNSTLQTAMDIGVYSNPVTFYDTGAKLEYTVGGTWTAPTITGASGTLYFAAADSGSSADTIVTGTLVNPGLVSARVHPADSNFSIQTKLTIASYSDTTSSELRPWRCVAIDPVTLEPTDPIKYGIHFTGNNTINGIIWCGGNVGPTGNSQIRTIAADGAGVTLTLAGKSKAMGDYSGQHTIGLAAVNGGRVYITASAELSDAWNVGLDTPPYDLRGHNMIGDGNGSVEFDAGFKADPNGSMTAQAITGVVLDNGSGKGVFTVAGDQTARYTPALTRAYTGGAWGTEGATLVVTGSTGNDGVYTVDNATLVGGNTEITVSRAIPDSTVDGTLAASNGDEFVHMFIGKTTVITRATDNLPLARYTRGGSPSTAKIRFGSGMTGYTPSGGVWNIRDNAQTFGGKVKVMVNIAGTIQTDKKLTLGGELTLGDGASLTKTGTDALEASSTSVVSVAGMASYTTSAGNTSWAGTIQSGATASALSVVGNNVNTSIAVGVTVQDAQSLSIDAGAINWSTPAGKTFAIGSSASFTKLGTGTLNINGGLELNGALLVNAGTVLVNVNDTGTTGTVTVGGVSGTPTLGGTGTINRPVTVKSGATLHPGGSIGKLTVGADISHEAGSIFAWEAKGYTIEADIGTAGTDYSQVVMTSGKFAITGGTLGKLYFPSSVNFSGTFWDSNRTWDIITGGSSSSLGSIADADISVYVDGSLYDGGDRTIAGQGAFSIAYVADGILRLTWTTEYYQWKKLHFTAQELEDPLVSGDDADPDGDGMTNLQEFLAGTDPRDSDSCLVVLGVEPRADGVVVSWSSETARFYRIETATNLVVGFDHTVKTNIAAAPPVNVYTDSPPAEAGSRFYRVRLE